MTPEEIRLQVAISVIQGVLEAKHGVIGEVVPSLAVTESLRIADEFVKQWYHKHREQKSVEYLNKDKAYAIMTKLTNLSYSKLIPINSDEYKKLHEITSDVRDLLDYPIEQKYTNSEKPKEWSEEDELMRTAVIQTLERFGGRGTTGMQIDWLKSLPERFNLQPKQEGEPMEIKFAGKIYKVYGTKELPGGGVGYIIEDEPGHYDCIIHPEEVLGGGYGIKSHGSPYPTKGTNFSQPHWKPSEEQLSILGKVFAGCELNTTERESMVDLFNNLKQML